MDDGSRQSTAAGPKPVAVALAPGTRVGRFVVNELLSAGAMGVVYRAVDPELGREVALKLFRRSGAPEALRGEAQALAKLNHPNVVAVYELGPFGDGAYIAMELVDGVTLGQFLSERPRPRHEVLALFAQAGRGLQAAHDAGVVHCDFKPANVLVGRDGRVRVADFGLARQKEDPGAAGTAVGTPAYWAPEVALGVPAAESSDQFSFCRALREALTEPPAWLRRALDRGMAARPVDRYPSMEALLAALARDPARRRRRLVTGGAAVLGLAAGAWLVAVRGGNPCGAAGLAGAWDDARREQVRAAFAATQVPFAPDTFAAAAGALDAYATAWTAKTKEVCGATRNEAFDLRMRCLEQARRELGAVVGVLAAADPPTVRNAARATEGLAPLANCDDVDGLAAAAPRDPVVRERVAQGAVTMVAAKTLSNIGKVPEALRLYDGVARAAHDVGFAAQEAEALSRGGGLLLLQRDLPGAEARLRAAIAAAEEAGDDEGKSESWRSLALLVGVYLRRFPEAHQYLRNAEAALGRVAGPRAEKQRADIAFYEAKLYENEGRLEEALPLAEGAMAVFERLLPQDPVLASRLNDHATMLAKLGRYPEAARQLERALALFQRYGGDAHPGVPVVLSNLGSLARDEGDFHRARDLMRRSLAVARKYGPGTTSLALAAGNLAGVEIDLGAPADAVPLAQEAAAIYRQRHGPQNAWTAWATSLVGAAYLRTGRAREAVDQLETALAVQESMAVEQEDLAQTRLRLGMALWAARRDPRAHDLVDRARRDLVALGRESVAGIIEEAQAWLAEHPRGR